jgi:hypothetical protein
MNNKKIINYNPTASTFNPDESWLKKNYFYRLGCDPLTTYRKDFLYGYLEFESNSEVSCRWTYFIESTNSELCLKNEKDYCKLLNLFNHFGGEIVDESR